METCRGLLAEPGQEDLQTCLGSGTLRSSCCPPPARETRRNPGACLRPPRVPAGSRSERLWWIDIATPSVNRPGRTPAQVLVFVPFVP